MKKIMFFASALAGLFLAASCQQENLEPVMSGNTVTYTVQIADAVGTKAIGDNVNAVDELVYEVWRTEGTEVESFSDADNLLYHKTAEIQDGVANIELEFVNDQNFTVLFWAQTKDNVVYDASKLTEVKIVSQDVTNVETAAAFVGRDFVKDCKSKVNGKVTLVRPVSQLNIGTTAESLNIEGQTDVALEGATVKVKGLATSYNIATLSATGEATTAYADNYTERECPTVPLEIKTDANTTAEFEYVAMNYVGFASNAGSTITVSYVINTTEGDISDTIENVPVKPNYRTNIIGNLITSRADYTITLDAQWHDLEGGNMEIVEEGIVKNLNGDYEVSSDKGLAYAMNNLFELGGNFYLTAPEYDLTKFNVTAPSVAENVTLRIYGETPVVTRSTVSVAGVTITGLTGSFLDEVKGYVLISGVNLTESNSVLVKNNEGNVVITDTEADTLVSEGNPAVEADNVQNIETLKDALASDVKVIDLTADIEADEFISISRSVTINGNGHKIISSASRIIRFQKNKGIEVVFNDLHGVSTAKFVYGIVDSIRGFSIDTEVHNMVFTLNNCSIDFADPTATDWSYAINLVSSENNTVTINGGTYEGANVVNVWGKSHTFNISNATLTSLYAANNNYYGYCVSLQEATGCKLTMINNTFNGSNAIAYIENDANNTVIAENNIDNTMYYRDSQDGAVYYVASAEKLQDAINMAKPETSVITFTNDIVGDVTVIQKEGINLVINGDGYKYDGTIKIHSNSNHYTTSAVTFKNINFATATSSLNFIEALENGSERYSTNITVEECTFTATGDAINTVVGLQIKSSNNVKVLKCTSNDMHSLVQANSCNSNVEVKNCTIAGKGGVSFTQVKEVTVENCTITASGYGIRYDGRVDEYGITVKDNNITADQPFIVRKMTGANNTITLEGKNTFTTEMGYHVIITNGSDDEEYVAPTGTYCLTGGEDYIVYPRDYAVCTSTELQAALKAKAPKIYIAADINVSEKWDNRYTGSKTSHAIEIDGLGHTLKFTGEINDGANRGAVFYFTKEASVKNLTIDVSGATHNFLVRAISAAENLALENCTFIGNLNHSRNNAVVVGDCGDSTPMWPYEATITDCTFQNWRRGISDNENGMSEIKMLTIQENTFTSAPVNVSAHESITFCDNATDSDVRLTSYTNAANTKVKATGNALNTEKVNWIGAGTKYFSSANVEAQSEFTVTTLD